MLRIDSAMLDWLRAFAKEPGALMMPLQTTRTRIMLWAADINMARTDVELIALIQKAVDEARTVSERAETRGQAKNISEHCDA